MMNSIIDSHCHLADPRLRDDVDGAIGRAREAGVDSIVAVGAIGPIDTDRLTVEIAERDPGVYAVVGVHPHDARELDDARLVALRELAQSDRVVAIGETGLDFHYLHSPAEAQERSLRAHLRLAAELGRPVVIHCRAAERELCRIVREAGMPPAGGVIHCFSSDAAWAREFLALGFYISFSGILTFKNAAAVREAARVVPEDRLMVETDAPYLAPEPYRGRRNEPAYVRRTLEALAEVRGADATVLADRTAANTRHLFRLETSRGPIRE